MIKEEETDYREEEETDYLKEISDNIRIRLRRMDVGKRTQRKLATYLALTEETLSKKLKLYDTKFTVYELIKISEYLNVSVDELITGRDYQNKESVERTKLRTFAIDWLASIREEKKYLAEVIDVVLENEEIAEMLFTMAYLYCTKYVPSIGLRKSEKTGGLEIDLTATLSDKNTLFKHAITDMMITVLDRIKVEYGKNAFNAHTLETDEKIHSAIVNMIKRMEEKEQEEYLELAKDYIIAEMEAGDNNPSKPSKE